MANRTLADLIREDQTSVANLPQVDLGRVKRNVVKMMGQNAPETDIDAYIASEGTTVDAVRQHQLELTPAQKADREVAAHGVRDPQGMGQGLVQFTNLMFDPLGVMDEIQGGGAAIRDYASNLVNKDFWTGKSSGAMSRAAQAYEDEAELVRAENRAARKRFGIIPELIGSFGTTGIVNAPTAATSFLGNVKSAAKTGAGYGAVSGATQSEGGALNRLLGSAEGAATGAVLAPALGSVVLPATARFLGGTKDAVKYANRMLKGWQDPEQVAVENVADRMVAAGLDPATARAAVSPEMSANLGSRGFTDADIADIISRQMRGESAASVAADYAHRVNAQGQKFTAETARSYLNKYQATNPTPMNLIDIAKEQIGEGASGPLWRLGRAANSLSGDESAEAAQALLSRQEDQSGRVTGIIRKAVGNRDYEQTLEEGIRNLKAEAGKAYKNFNAEPDLAINQLGDLIEDPTFREAMLYGQRQARVEAMKRNAEARRAGQPQEPILTVDPEAQMFSPETLDYIQRQLRIKSESLTDTNAARHAQNLRQVFLDRIEDHYPTFRPIRERYAQMKGEYGEEGALQAGRDLTNRLGQKTDDALREFSRMTAAQKELFRLGFARNIMDMAANPQIGGAVANRFNTRATREIISKLFKGDKDLEARGSELIRNLRREAITTKTKNDVLSGSRTAELENDMGRLMEGAQAAADISTGRFSALLKNLSTRLTTQMGRRGATETMRILTETDPAQLLPLLNRLAKAAKTSGERRAYVAALREFRALGGAQGVSAVTGQESGRQMAVRP